MKKWWLRIILISLWFSLLVSLVIEKRSDSRRKALKDDLRKQILAYVEKSEEYPDTLAPLGIDLKKLPFEVTYEVFSNRAGCKVIVDGREKFELWLDPE
jgi:hypothetical protein